MLFASLFPLLTNPTSSIFCEIESQTLHRSETQFRSTFDEDFVFVAMLEATFEFHVIVGGSPASCRKSKLTNH